MDELMNGGMFDVPQNPLADLIGNHELHGGAPGTVGGLVDGLTVEYGGREYYVDQLNSHDPNAHDPNRAPSQQAGQQASQHTSQHTSKHNASGAYGTNSRSNSWHGSGGVEESVTIADDQGMSILSDTDGDGKVDYVSSVSYDGQWSAWRWIEDAEVEGASPRNNSDTPDTGNNQWQADAWKCVDRGQWG